jgi:hypothetical protein
MFQFLNNIANLINFLGNEALAEVNETLNELGLPPIFFQSPYNKHYRSRGNT